MKKHWLKILIGLLILVAIAGVLAQSGDEEAQSLIVKPVVGPFQVTASTTGELQAKNSVEIYGPVGARQVGIWQMKIDRLVPEGTVVQKGEFVAELDRSELGTKIQSAQVELQKAQSQYEQTMLDSLLTLSQARDEQVNLRYAMEEARLTQEQARFEAPSVQRQAEIEYEKAERRYSQAVDNYQTKVKQSEAKMREVEANLSKAQNELDNLMRVSGDFTVTAPENGMVIYDRQWNGQKLTAGGTINAWDPVVAELPDLSRMESVTYVNEVDIQKIQMGQPVQIGLDADPDKKLTGSVTEIANIGEQRPNSDAKVFQVKVLVNESDTTLRPSMTTSNVILVAEIPEALYVPIESIHTRDSLNYVFLRQGRGIIRQEVRLGLLNESDAIVEAGLSPESQIYLSIPPDTSGLSFEPLSLPEEKVELAERE